MSMIFDHWFEDEQSNTTNGEIDKLRYDNQKLKEAINKIKEEIKSYEHKNGIVFYGGIHEAIEIIDKHTEGLV